MQNQIKYCPYFIWFCAIRLFYYFIKCINNTIKEEDFIIMFLKNGYQTMVLYVFNYNEGKSVLAERFIRTLKNKLYKHMTATGKNVYYDVLDDIVNEYNNTKHNTIKMKPRDVGNNKRVYIDEHKEKDSRFKVGDRVRISKFKNIFAKGYTPN